MESFQSTRSSKNIEYFYENPNNNEYNFHSHFNSSIVKFNLKFNITFIL